MSFHLKSWAINRTLASYRIERLFLTILLPSFNYPRWYKVIQRQMDLRKLKLSTFSRVSAFIFRFHWINRRLGHMSKRWLKNLFMRKAWTWRARALPSWLPKMKNFRYKFFAMAKLHFSSLHSNQTVLFHKKLIWWKHIAADDPVRTYHLKFLMSLQLVQIELFLERFKIQNNGQTDSCVFLWKI